MLKIVNLMPGYYKPRVRSLQENLKSQPCRIDLTIIPHEGWRLKVNKQLLYDIGFCTGNPNTLSVIEMYCYLPLSVFLSRLEGI